MQLQYLILQLTTRIIPQTVLLGTIRVLP